MKLYVLAKLKRDLTADGGEPPLLSGEVVAIMDTLGGHPPEQYVVVEAQRPDAALVGGYRYVPTLARAEVLERIT